MKPSNVGTGLVTGQFGIAVADGLDPDKEPEVLPLQGTITFTPSVEYLPNLTSEPNPITIMTGPIEAVLDSEGYVCTPGPDGITPFYRGIRLMATDDPDLSVVNWTWSVVYSFNPVRGRTPKKPAHPMSLLEGAEEDLTKVAPVPSSPGIGTPQALALLQQAVEAAALAGENSSAALEVVARADAGEFKGERGLTGLNGANVLPTDIAIAQAVKTPGSDTVTALSTAFVTAQTDYVELLAARSRTTRLQLSKYAGGFQVSCITPDNLSHMTYQFPTPVDDYWIAGEVWAGAMGTTNLADSKGFPVLTKTGVYNSASATPFTTEVGATFTGTVVLPRPGRIAFKHYGDDRGGMWRLTLNGAASKDITTWSVAAGTVEDTAWSNLGAGTYVVAGTFMGNDPAHTPTATARGWLARSDGSQPEVLAYTAGPVMETLVAPKSNRDFALRIAPASGGTSEFVPHHGVPTGVSAETMKVYDGGTVIDVASMTTGQTIDITSFELAQHIYGRNPATGSANLIELWTTHRIYADGRLAINGRFKTLADLIFNRSYVIMGPVRNAVFDKCVTSIRKEYESTPAMHGTSTYLTAESDTAESFCFLSSTRPELGMAFRYNNSAETIRRGQPNKREAGTRSMLEHRNADFLKHYQFLYADDAPVPAGTVHRFSGDYVHVSAPSVLSLLRLS